MKFISRPGTHPFAAKKRMQGIRLLVWGMLMVLAGSGLWSCSKKMPCPKIPKQKKDTAFTPESQGEGNDETNNPNDNKANMTFGGGGFKRGKDGLVKRGKFKNLMSKNKTNRNYTKLKMPAAKHDHTKGKYTKINDPAANSRKDRPDYTDIDEPGSKQPKNKKYTDIDEPGSKPQKNITETALEEPASASGRKGRKKKEFATERNKQQRR